MTGNQIAYWNSQLQEGANLEQARHNRAAEENNARANAITEKLGILNAQISQFRANEEARHNAASERLIQFQNYLNSQALLETSRHNKAVELETFRSDVKRERETTRHNVSTESLSLLNSLLGEVQSRRANETNRERNAVSRYTGTINMLGGLIGTAASTYVSLSRDMTQLVSTGLFSFVNMKAARNVTK